MGVIYLIMMTIPVALAILVWLVLNRLTRLPAPSQATVAIFVAPALFLILYTLSSLPPTPEKRATFALPAVIYIIVNVVLIGLLEWRQRGRK